MEYTTYIEIYFLMFLNVFLIHCHDSLLHAKRIWMRYIAAAFESSLQHYKLGYWQSISP